jgi:hypothetical protein
MTSVS